MLPDLTEIFKMDRLLKRTFLLLCPLQMFGKLLKTGCFSCLDLCVTLKKLLSFPQAGYSITPKFVSTMHKIVNTYLPALGETVFLFFGDPGECNTLLCFSGAGR